MEDCESVSGSGSVCGFTALNPRIRLLISDLDNTLYDWLSFFVPSFYAMVDVAASELGVDRERLLDELRAVHRHYGSSEHPYALLETQTVKARYGWATPAQQKEILDPAFKAFNAARKAMLRLYPSVSEGLRAIRLSGTRVVAYTESVVYNVVHRLELLQVLDQIDFVYAPSGRGGLRFRSRSAAPAAASHAQDPPSAAGPQEAESRRAPFDLPEPGRRSGCHLVRRRQPHP